MRQSETLYRSVVENIDVGIGLMDSHYTVLAVNAAQARMFGKTPAELVGKKCYREFEKRDAVCPQCHGRAAMATGRPTERVREGVRDDGSRFAVRVRACPLAGPDGSATGFIELVEDITGRRQTEECLRCAKEAAEAANKAKSEFLANVSHEIRTPLTAILGFTELLASPNLPCQEQREFLTGIQRNGRALTELIGDILDLSRIEAGRLTLERVDCPLRQLVDDVLSLVQVRAGQKGLRLAVDYAAPLPETIHTDPAHLRQVLANLIGNAVKFTERRRSGHHHPLCSRGGRPGTRAVRHCRHRHRHPRRQDRRPFPALHAGGRVCQPPLWRHGAAAWPSPKRLAKALGGDVKVVSELGKGSTFTLTIEV